MEMQTDATYEEVLAQAQRLSPEGQARLIEELMADLRQHLESQQLHSITELRGVGKEFWQGIDVEQYIKEERSSWNG